MPAPRSGAGKTPFSLHPERMLGRGFAPHKEGSCKTKNTAFDTDISRGYVSVKSDVWQAPSNSIFVGDVSVSNNQMTESKKFTKIYKNLWQQELLQKQKLLLWTLAK